MCLEACSSVKKIFSVFNIAVIIIAFCIGMFITKYEEKYGVLTVANRNILENEEKVPPTFEKEEGKININNATADELKRLPGIGEKLSARVIEYRQNNGNFEVPQDIMKVGGIGESLYSDISEFICVY